MRTKISAVALGLVLLVAVTASAADTYKIDLAHSSIDFSVRHLGLAKVNGDFADFNGVIVYDPENMANSSVNVTIKTASVDTDNDERDKHLRTDDFLLVEKYPEMTFVSKKIEKTEDGMVAHGTLTIRGVSKEISLPFEVFGPIEGMRGEQRIAAEAETTINRHDFGVSYGKGNLLQQTGDLVIGDEVDIEITIQAVLDTEENQ